MFSSGLSKAIGWRWKPAVWRAVAPSPERCPCRREKRGSTAGSADLSYACRKVAGRDIVRAMLHVFHREHAGRPRRVLWMLEEIGEPYELTIMNWEQGSGEEHRARHPLGRVPVVHFDDGYVFESTAICLQLADLYPDAHLIGALGTHARALAYQWSIFAPAELEPPLIEAAIFGEADPQRAGKARGAFSRRSMRSPRP